MQVKFLYNGIKVDGKLFRASFSKGPYTAFSEIPDNSIMVIAKDWVPFPKFTKGIKNESDIMTDYFEKDSIVIKPCDPYYNDALNAFEKMQAKYSR